MVLCRYDNKLLGVGSFIRSDLDALLKNIVHARIPLA